MVKPSIMWTVWQFEERRMLIDPRRKSVKKEQHLPFLGIGPIYVISILFLTLIALLLRDHPVFAAGRLNLLRVPLIIIGVLVILMSVFMWIQAVLVSKLHKNIKENHLLTSGVYAWVRQPFIPLLCFSARVSFFLLAMPASLFFLWFTGVCWRCW